MTIDGKQVNLRVYTPPPEGYEEAVREGERLKAEAGTARRSAPAPALPPPPAAPQPPPPPVVPKGPTVATEVTRFAAEALPKKKAPTRESYTHRLAWLVERFGQVNVADLTPPMVETAVGEVPGWGNSTKRLTIAVIQVFVRWTGRNEWSAVKPTEVCRDERCVLSKDEFNAVMNLCNGDFGPLVRFMFLVGCRPGEARKLTADMVNWQSGRVVLTDHKTVGKTGRPKSLYLSNGALKILTEQRDKYGVVCCSEG